MAELTQSASCLRLCKAPSCLPGPIKVLRRCALERVRVEAFGQRHSLLQSVWAIVICWEDLLRAREEVRLQDRCTAKEGGL